MTGASPCTVNEMMMMKILTDPKLGPSDKYIIIWFAMTPETH